MSASRLLVQKYGGSSVKDPSRIAAVAARIAMALVSGWFTMRSVDVLKLIWLIPVRDLYGFAVWLTALFGKDVVWRGRKMRLDAEGRIH